MPLVNGYRQAVARTFMQTKPGFSWNDPSVLQTELQRH